MEALIFKVLLSIHVVTGSVGLLLGSLVLFMTKGNRQHKSVGKVFAYSMLLSASVALVMAALHSSYFLFVIGVFTLYLVLSGLRYLKVKETKANDEISWQDKLIFGTMCVFALAFGAIGARLVSIGQGFGYVLLVFGLISVFLLRQDVLFFKGISKFKNQWLLMHITRMIAAYIAAFTAFLVVNNTYLPQLIAWLLPTVLFTPLIIYWTGKYGVPIIKSDSTKEQS